MLQRLIIFSSVLVCVCASGALGADKTKQFPNLIVVNHPLVDHKLTLLRKKETDTPAFRKLLREVAMLIGYEVTKFLPTKEIEIETPLAKTKERVINEDEIVIVPILRAGLGMADGLHQLIPSAREGQIGLYRDPKTKKPVEYLFKMPEIKNQIFVVVDPMLATGNSSVYAVSKLREKGIPEGRIILMTLLSAPEGVKNFQENHPGVRVITAALDDHLDSHAYIVPGLGDAGDRLYGTE